MFSQSSDQFLGCSEWLGTYLAVFKGWGKHRVLLLSIILTHSLLYVFFERLSIRVLCPVLNLVICSFFVFVFVCYWVVGFTYIFWILNLYPYIRYMVCKYFLSFYMLLFCFVDCFLSCAEHFQFYVISLVFAFIVCTFLCHIQNIITRWMPKSFFPYSSSRCFTASDLIFKYLSHFEFMFVYSATLLYENIQFSHYHLLKRPSFPQFCIHGAFVKISWLYMHGFISELFTFFHWSMYLFFMPVIFCFD